MVHGQIWPGPRLGDRPRDGFVPKLPEPGAEITLEDVSGVLGQILELLSENPPMQRLPAEVETVMTHGFRSTGARPSTVFAWPLGGPVGILVENTLDAPLRIEVHANLTANNSPLLDEPLLTIDAGANRRIARGLHPQGDDPWLPYLFLNVRPLDLPTKGQAILHMARAGA